MAISNVQCIVLACDQCGVEAFNDNRGEYEYTSHFRDVDDAHETATREGWHVYDGRALCTTCVAREVCAHVGHSWSDWFDVCTETYIGRSRWCLVCPAHDYNPVPPYLADQPTSPGGEHR